MAYQFDFQTDPQDFLPSPDGAGGHAIEFPLGFDTDAGLIVLMAVMLTATDDPNALELHFGIRERIGMGAASDADYSKETADRYIPKDLAYCRLFVQNSIRRAVAALFQATWPDYVLMETFYGNLAPKAMRKYDSVCTTVGLAGYIVEQQWRNPEDDKDYWVFKRF